MEEAQAAAAEAAQQQRAKVLAAAKQAKLDAAALRAAERKATLKAVAMKLAATKARGEALKQKSSWINLMKYFPKSLTIKKVVTTKSK